MSRIRSILFLTYHFPPEVGGIQTRIANYCKSLSRRGIDVSVFVPRSRGPETLTYMFQGAKVTVCPGGTKYLFTTALRLVKAAAFNHVDVIHVLTGGSTFLGVFALMMGRMLMVPSVFSVFGREDVVFTSPLGSGIFLISAEISTSITTNSSATKRLLSARFWPKTTVLLGGGEVDTTVENHATGGWKIILFVGRLVKRKVIDDLLQAFEMVKKAIPDSRLVIVGEGPERTKLYQKSMVENLRDVEFKGALFGESLAREYARCSVCVLPSKYVKDDPANEGLGLTLIEASMHGKPIIGTLHGGIPEIVKDGVNGFLVPEGNPRKLAESIIRLVSDEELNRKMGEKALELATSKFTWDAATERLLDSYSK